MKGNVYILSNPSYKDDILKIGYTTRTVEERIDELSSTGVPTKFQLEFCLVVENAPKLEQILHKKLSNQNYNKEFFKISISKAVEVCKITLLEIDFICYEIYGRASDSFLTSAEVSEIETKKKALLEKERIRNRAQQTEDILISKLKPLFSNVCSEMNEVLKRRMPKDSNARSAMGYLAILSVVGMFASDSIFFTPEKKAIEIYKNMNPYEIKLFKEFLRIESELVKSNTYKKVVNEIYSQNPMKYEYVLWNDKSNQFGSDYVYNSPYVEKICSLISN